jgi:multicomponent Na+:H+ antiporter subunit F
MDTVVVLCYCLLAVSGALGIARIARAPSLADRALALDAILVTGVVGVGVESARTGHGVYLDVLLIVALVAFVGSTAVARYIEQRGAR